VSESILPKGYYSINDFNEVVLKVGPYKGLKFKLVDKIKIREEYLTGTPQLCYDYKIADYSGYDKTEVESSIKLSRIVAAIVIELAYPIIEEGSAEGIEGNEWTELNR
jgi:hypothetical protein